MKVGVLARDEQAPQAKTPDVAVAEAARELVPAAVPAEPLPPSDILVHAGDPAEVRFVRPLPEGTRWEVEPSVQGGESVSGLRVGWTGPIVIRFFRDGSSKAIERVYVRTNEPTRVVGRQPYLPFAASHERWTIQGRTVEPYEGTEAGRDDGRVRLPRLAPREELARAIEERLEFDGLSIELPPEPPSILIGRTDLGIVAQNWLTERLSRLDEVVALRHQLRTSSDAELEAAWDACAADETFNPGPLLLEMASRHEARFRVLVEAAFAKLRKTQVVSRWSRYELTLVALLRRLDGKPDPVALRAQAPKPSEFPALPTIEAEAWEMDAAGKAGRAYWFREPAGFLFHLEIRDPRGRLVPVRDVAASRWEHGPRQTSHVRDGNVMVLALADFVEPSHLLLPGRYTVVVHHSDAGGIDRPDGFLWAITFRSDPVAFDVTRRRVAATEADRKRYLEIAAQLPTTPSVDVFLKGYQPWAYGRVLPAEPAGKLLTVGWAAVPSLIEFASDPSQLAGRRAWAFAILRSVTGALNPADFRGACGPASQHRETLSEFAPSGAPIDAAAQNRLARLWVRFREGIEWDEAK